MLKVKCVFLVSFISSCKIISFGGWVGVKGVHPCSSTHSFFVAEVESKNVKEYHIWNYFNHVTTLSYDPSLCEC